MCQTPCDFVKGVLTCLDRFNNSMHVCVFIFRQAQGKGSAHGERHGDGLAGGGVVSGAWQLGLPFTGAAMRMALPVSLQGTLLTPHPGGPACGGRGFVCFCAGCETSVYAG